MVPRYSRFNGRFRLLTRRSTLGLLATAAILPSRAIAHVAPPRNEIRESLAKRFTDAGTAGTFVGYKVEDYLIVASDPELADCV
jgi:beta-lactamase class D